MFGFFVRILLLLLLLLLQSPPLLGFATAGAATAPTLNIDTWQQGQGGEIKNNDDDATTIYDLVTNWRTIGNTPFAEYWDDLPAYDNVTGVVDVVVDGYSFRGRQSLYKALIKEDPYHWLWAYAAQLDWQHRSGRLSLGKSKEEDDDDDDNHEDAIDTNSWWGYMNFQFSVAVYLGYQQATTTTTTSSSASLQAIQLDDKSQYLVDHDLPTQLCIQEWARVFQASSRSRSNHNHNNISGYELQKLVWKAHTAVIRHVQEKGTNYHKLLQHLPAAEQSFGHGWARMVHILAAACFPTDLVTLLQDGGGFLPLAVLDDTVWQAMILSNRNKNETFYEACRRRTVEATHQLANMPDKQLQGIISFWQRVSHSEGISRQLPRVIVSLYHGSLWTKIRQGVKVLVWAFQPRRRRPVESMEEL